MEDNNLVQNESNKKLIIIICALGAGILALVIAIAIVLFSITRHDADNNIDEEEVTVEESVSEEENVVTEEEPEVEEVVEEEPYTLLVCAPSDYMSLRRNPGLNDEDEILKLYGGEYLKWYGEFVTEEDTTFYKVKTKADNTEGWVSSDFTIEVDFDYNPDDLPIVETTNPLYTYDMMVNDINALCSKYPGVLNYNIRGQSNMGQNLYEVILGNPNAPHHVMAQATIHGREYVNTQLVMKLIEYYAQYYETGEYKGISYKDLFDNTAFHIVTMTNPDGVAISQFGYDFVEGTYMEELTYEAYERDRWTMIYQENSNGDMSWIDYYRDDKFNRDSKPEGSRMITYEEYLEQWKCNADGVDLNNNFEADWDNIQLKNDPSYTNFKGYYPVSEPETQMLVDMALSEDFDCYISYHSTGSLLYYDCIGNDDSMSVLEENFATVFNNHLKYKKSNLHNSYNTNLGGFGDWIQLGLKKASITIESGKKPCPLPMQEFPGIWARHRESWAMLAAEYY